jgi:uncharacterized membrane protein YgaE (UPF0421/DUF939 family)
LKAENKNLLLYILKCVTGSAIVFLLSWLFDYTDISWGVISVILVLTPESKEAIPLALTRIKANLLGGITSLVCMTFFPPNAFTIIAVIVMTIVGCYKLRIMEGSRAAIAAVIIIMMHGIETQQTNFWTITLQRIGFVIGGCVIGLLVTLVYHRDFIRKSKLMGKPDEA